LTFATLLGKARGVLAMSLFSRFIVKEDCDSYYLFFKRLVETGKPQSCELRIVKEVPRGFQWLT
ncbi:MAG: sensor domain-containing diguanylate cyclase, partial [candidate division NC10 bacterium]